MAFCPNCGASVEGRFCQKCGAAVGAGPSTGAPPPPPTGGPYAPPPPPPNLSAPGLPSNVAALLCYIIPIVCPIIFLVVDPYKSDRKIRFDAFQSIFLTVAFIALGIMLTFVWAASWTLAAVLSPIVHLAELVLVIFLAFKAYQNQKVVLPVIGPIAEKQA